MSASEDREADGNSATRMAGQNPPVDVSDLTAAELLKFQRISRMRTDDETEILARLRAQRPQSEDQPMGSRRKNRSRRKFF